MSNRYYAIVKAGSDLSKPCPVLGWVEQPVLRDGTVTPYQAAPGFEAIPLNMSDDDWATRTADPQNPMQIYNGEISPYVSPGPTLKERAATAVQQARSAIYNNYGILNEPTPDAWVSYLKALMAIENGTDTTSTALPTGPHSKES